MKADTNQVKFKHVSTKHTSHLLLVSHESHNWLKIDKEFKGLRVGHHSIVKFTEPVYESRGL